MPRAATLDRKWNESANTLFDEWAGRADFTGRFDFWDLQRLGSCYLDTDVEVFALWTDEAGFPQIQLLESWRIDKPTIADDRIFDGVQLDTQGRVQGYWLDGQTLLDANALVHLCHVCSKVSPCIRSSMFHPCRWLAHLRPVGFCPMVTDC